jgi:hypothetical protein
VTQNGVNLVVTGDAADDFILIQSSGDGEVSVQADTNDDGVLEYLEYSGVKHIRVTTGDGDDDIIALGLDIDGHFTVDTGNGADLVALSAFGDPNHIGGNVSVSTGAANDEVFIAGVEIDGKLTIGTGDGDDYVAIGDGFYAYSDILSLSITTNGDVDVDGKTTIETGNGFDFVSIGGEIEEDDVTLGDLVINTGAGDDFVEFNAFYDSVYGEATYVTVEGRTDINLGAGDDLLDIDADYGYLTFEGNFSADGGAGDDVFDDLDDAVFGGKSTLKNFESIS